MNKKLIVVAGPTAVGKTEYAIKLAKEIETEIISADSRQIYKEMKIGTARPTPEELAQVKHHFIATHSVTEYYNASKYEFEAIELIENLFKKYDKLVVAGGSGLYIDAILFGIDDLPTIDQNIRRELQEKFQNEGLESLRFMLKKLDPVYYDRVDLKNPKRILKALEVAIQTGKPYSSFLTGKAKKRNFEFEIIILNKERNVLHERINKRVDFMIENGLIDEARNLLKYRHLTPLKTVGYRELFDFFDNKIDLQTAIELIKRNTRRYARRQITWFKKYL
jgi:tRNA dimethylallyltransferase